MSTNDADRDPTRSGRRYPLRPVAGVGGVIITDAGEVVLVRRRFDPLKGRWTLPGGVLELGEPARAAVAREVLEETGLSVDVGGIVDVVDHIDQDADGRTEYHYVIADYLCRPLGGTIEAGSDVDAVALAGPATLVRYTLTEQAHAVIRRGFEMYTATGRHS